MTFTFGHTHPGIVGTKSTPTPGRFGECPTSCNIQGDCKLYAQGQICQEQQPRG